MTSPRPTRTVGAGHLQWSVRPDLLLWAALALAVLGLVMTTSADVEPGRLWDGHASRRALALGAAVLLAMSVYRFPLAQVERASVALLLLALTLLSAVLIPGLGVMVNGAQSYLALGPFRLLVAGMATLMFLVCLVAYLARQMEDLRWQGVRFPQLGAAWPGRDLAGGRAQCAGRCVPADRRPAHDPQRRRASVAARRDGRAGGGVADRLRPVVAQRGGAVDARHQPLGNGVRSMSQVGHQHGPQLAFIERW